MPRLLLFIFTVTFSPLLMAGEEAQAYLKQYVGRWKGDFTIHSAAANYTRSFPVEQRYWWEDGALHGLSVSDTSEGMRTARSKTVFENDRFVSEVERDETVETYFGVLHDGGIVWLSSDLGRATDYQLRESFVEVDGAMELHTDGFDSYVYQGGLAHLVYRGRLKRETKVGQ